MSDTQTQTHNEEEALFEQLLLDLNTLEKERENLLREYQTALESKKAARLQKNIASL